MIKEVPQSSWVDFLMNFAKDHEGEMVRLYAHANGDERKLIGEAPLISFEGDCDGEIVDGVKVVIGAEGEKPDNLFHYIKAPIGIKVNEETNGVVDEIMLEDGDNKKTSLELWDRD